MEDNAIRLHNHLERRMDAIGLLSPVPNCGSSSVRPADDGAISISEEERERECIRRTRRHVMHTHIDRRPINHFTQHYSPINQENDGSRPFAAGIVFLAVGGCAATFPAARENEGYRVKLKVRYGNSRAESSARQTREANKTPASLPMR